MGSRNSIPKQLIASVVIIAVVGACGAVLISNGKSENPSTPSAANTDLVSVSGPGKEMADIETAVVQSTTIENRLKTTGQVEFPLDRTVKISPRLQGRVRQVLVRVGDHVKAGQTLALLDSVDAATAENTVQQNANKLRLAKMTLDRSERMFRLRTPEVTSAQATLDQAKASVLAAKDVLDKTKLQEKIGGFTQKPLEDAENSLVAARSTLSQAESDLALAQKDYTRKVKLVEIGVAAKSDLEISQDTLEKAKTNVDADQESVKLAQQAVTREKKAFSTNLYADQQVQQASSAYRQSLLQQDAADRALRLAKAAIQRDLEQSRSDYRSAQFDYDNSRRALTLLGNPSADGTVPVSSPQDGVITERDVSDGQVVDQSQMTPWQMFVVSDDSVVWVEADVYEKDIASTSLGDPVEISVGALPGRKFQGKIIHIAPTLDPKSRAIKVRAEIDNKAHLLKDGEFADVSISFGHPIQGILIPQSAIVHDGEDFVYLVDGGKYAKRKVTLGPQRGDQSQIESGLKPGDKIVTHGALFLGSQVNDD